MSILGHDGLTPRDWHVIQQIGFDSWHGGGILWIGRTFWIDGAWKCWGRPSEWKYSWVNKGGGGQEPSLYMGEGNNVGCNVMKIAWDGPQGRLLICGKTKFELKSIAMWSIWGCFLKLGVGRARPLLDKFVLKGENTLGKNLEVLYYPR